MRQSDVIAYLYTHGPSAPSVVGRALAPHSKAPNRAGQQILMRMSNEGLVVGQGVGNDRRYDLTDRGRRLAEDAARPAATQGPPPPGVAVPVREQEREIARLLDENGVPRSEGGRILTLAARVERALREQDAADTSIDESIRARARAVYEHPALRAVLRAALGPQASPDDVLRVVVEAGVAALTETPPGRA